MEQNGYYQPVTCIPGERYYMKNDKQKTPTQYKRVEFISYRPHPAEVVIREGKKPRVIHRAYLFQKNGNQSKK